MENELSALVDSLVHTYSALLDEIRLIEGDNLRAQVQWLSERLQSNHSARILWSLVAVLCLSVVVFFVSSTLALRGYLSTIGNRTSSNSVTSLTEKTVEEISTSHDEKIAETIEWAKKQYPENFVGLLKSGAIDEAETALLLELEKQSENQFAKMYLLACCATRKNVQAFESMVDKVFPKDLDADDEVCRHTAELGRLIGSHKFSIDRIPAPKSVFEIQSKQLGDALGSVLEFGSVQTLLDLMRVYFDSGEIGNVRHLMVEVLVGGSSIERRAALEYARLIANSSQSNSLP